MVGSYLTGPQTQYYSPKSWNDIARNLLNETQLCLSSSQDIPSTFHNSFQVLPLVRALSNHAVITGSKSTFHSSDSFKFWTWYETVLLRVTTVVMEHHDQKQLGKGLFCSRFHKTVHLQKQ